MRCDGCSAFISIRRRPFSVRIRLASLSGLHPKQLYLRRPWGHGEQLTHFMLLFLPWGQLWETDNTSVITTVSNGVSSVVPNPSQTSAKNKRSVDGSSISNGVRLRNPVWVSYFGCGGCLCIALCTIGHSSGYRSQSIM